MQQTEGVFNPSVPAPPPVGAEPGNMNPPPEAHGTGVISQPSVKPAESDSVAILLLLMPVFGLALLWFWVGHSILLFAGKNLTTTALIVVIGSAILAAIDASQIGMTRERGGASPATVAVAMVLLWFVTFPWYLSSRKKVGRKSYGIGAFLGMAIFILGYVVMHQTISEAFGQIWKR